MIIKEEYYILLEVVTQRFLLKGLNSVIKKSELFACALLLQFVHESGNFFGFGFFGTDFPEETHCFNCCLVHGMLG